MSQIKPIPVEKLRSFCRLASFDFTTTDDLADFNGLVGQSRAEEALTFAIEMDKPGYNMYLMGPNGLGKESLLNSFLVKVCEEQVPASDWCYVYHFAELDSAKLIALPAGQVKIFKLDMLGFIQKFENKIADALILSGNSQRLKAALAGLVNTLEVIKKRYSSVFEIKTFLKNIEKELEAQLASLFSRNDKSLKLDDCLDVINLQRFEVNSFVQHESESACPIIFEQQPSLKNLFGQVEYVSQLGALATDYRYIKAGSLHKANGGYLIIDADKLIQSPAAWEALKLTLKKQSISLSDTKSEDGISMVSMQPEAMPLSMKVILLGSRAVYHHLIEFDDDFDELFKVEVDFSDTIHCTKENLLEYASIIATLVRKNNCLPLDKSAVECIIEFGMRFIEDNTKLSTHMHSIQEILIESDYWAKKSKPNSSLITKDFVKLAIEKQIYRADRSRELTYDEINKGTVLIHTEGEQVGCVNGLFVIDAGRIEFAQAARITSNVRLGDGDIIDIEREVDLGGPLHSKGILILSSYLGSMYAKTKPLSLSASLVFEQSYGSVDGDSATVGELCCLLSAISQVPVKQSIAITGSADQHGNVQAIGGINEKIEGFYDICHLKGLTGKQGVILPEVNIPHLLLRDDVVDAIENNLFTLYPIKTVNEAISLLTGLDAGERNLEGEFPENSINYKVEQRLFELAELKHDDSKDEDEESKDGRSTDTNKSEKG